MEKSGERASAQDGDSPAERAGAQIEEPLATSVRSALLAAVSDAAPPRPGFETIEERLLYLRWLGEMSEGLKGRKAEHATRVETFAWHAEGPHGLLVRHVHAA